MTQDQATRQDGDGTLSNGATPIDQILVSFVECGVGCEPHFFL